MDWAVGKEFHFINNYFDKRKSQLITFSLSDVEMVINYILVNNRHRSRLKDINVIPGKKLVSKTF